VPERWRKLSVGGLTEEVVMRLFDHAWSVPDVLHLGPGLATLMLVVGSLAVPLGLAAAAEPKKETAIFAGGCFWGMENIIREIPGVLSTEVGYTGGRLPNPTYQQVCTGLTGHAEAVQIIYDPDTVSYETLVDYFFRMHDPTTPNRQHNDVGTQYRSAIFFTTEEQREIAMKTIALLTQQRKFSRPIVTQVAKAGVFYSAEDYHQDYLVKNPAGYNCHVLRDW
jgi:methionine-S-sulfoxide reductase